MKSRKLWIVVALLAVVAGFAVAQDLTIDYQYNTSRAVNDNYMTFTGPIRYIAVDKDHADATSGASALGTTHAFQPYRVDILGKNVLPDALRDVFLYAVNDFQASTDDNLDVSKDRNGVITIQFTHRSTAYRVVTDANGRINLPAADAQKRKIGFIVGRSADRREPRGCDRIDRHGRCGAGLDVLLERNAAGHHGRNILKIQGGLNAVKR